MVFIIEAKEQVLNAPIGITGIIKEYGFVPKDENERKKWEMKNIIEFKLPDYLKASWDYRLRIKKLRIHKKLQNIFEITFYRLYTECWDYILDCGGAYNYRNKSSNTYQLSTHSWGIAIDLNVKENAFGKKPKINKKIVKIFEDIGWTWGGRWEIPDGMHFQFAKNY